MKLITAIALFLSTILISQNQIEVKSLIKNFPGNGAITMHPNGGLLVNEYGTPNGGYSGSGQRIFLVKPNGVYSIFLENVNGPIGGVFDVEGSFYFNNGSSKTQSELMCLKKGTLQKIATIPGFAADLIIEKLTGDLIVTNYTLPILYRVDLDGNISEMINDERVKGCTGITYGEDETIYISNFSTGKIFKVDDTEQLIEFATVPVEYPGYVIGYITYFENKIYATGYGASKIYEIDFEGNVSVFAGNGERKDMDGNGSTSAFFVPNGIEIDKKKRRLYISQNGNNQTKSLRYIDLPRS